MSRGLKIELWNKNQFRWSRSFLDSLIAILDRTDLGVFLLTPDDLVASRQKSQYTPRDNVIFELGLFMGRHGCDRALMVNCRGEQTVRLPSDLCGINLVDCDLSGRDPNMSLNNVCRQIRLHVDSMQQSTWRSQWRDGSAVVAETLSLSKRLLSQRESFEVRGIRTLKAKGRKTKVQRVAGWQCGAFLSLESHGDKDFELGGTMLLKQTGNERLIGCVSSPEDSQTGTIRSVENQWVLDSSRMVCDPAWERRLNACAVAAVDTQSEAVTFLVDHLRRNSVCYLDYYDPQVLKSSHLPGNERLWEAALDRFLRRGGSVRYVFAENDRRRLARHKRLQKMGKRYEGRPFAAGLNSGLTIVMFGTGPETIDYAILYFDTNTSMPYILEVMDRAMLDALHHWFNFSFRATTT